MENHLYVGGTTIDKKLNWKFANDTFGETYHFAKLHKDTLGRIFYGNNLHFKEFGRHHRFVTASRGIDKLRQIPESDWEISQGTFVLYHLFPNIQLITSAHTTTLIRIYPHEEGTSRSVTKISFYYSQAAMDYASEQKVNPDEVDVYDPDGRDGGPSLEGSLEVFRSTIEHEDYDMGEMQQRAAENGQLKEIMFGRNEPALHHFHSNYREALGQPPLEAIN